MMLQNIKLERDPNVKNGIEDIFIENWIVVVRETNEMIGNIVTNQRGDQWCKFSDDEKLPEDRIIIPSQTASFLERLDKLCS